MDNNLGMTQLARNFIPELEIRPITSTDRQLWEPLWLGYLTFYEKALPPEVTEFTWNRLTTDHHIKGLLALRSGEALGFVHFLLHPSTSNVGGNCYLQDLFVVPAARGSRVGRRLIAAVAQEAREKRAALVYWQTEEFNGPARRLYEACGEEIPFYPLSN